MPLQFKAYITATLVSLAALAPPASAQSDADANQVLATVNGTEITLGHVITLRSELPQQYDQLPAALLFEGILDQLIRQTLLMQSLEGEPALASRLQIENERRAVLSGQVLGDIYANEIGEETLKAAYEAQYATGEPQTEYRASHILVDTVEAAHDLIAQLKDGADFAQLAMEHSTGPSGAVGGDLGWFGDGDMVPEFFNAVLALEAGGISEPVKTDFGWHVISLTETRDMEQPAFEVVRQEIETQMREAEIEGLVAELEGAAEIERTDTSGIPPESINNYQLLEN